MLGNSLYGLSVLLKNPEPGQGQGDYVLHHLPWLVGSLGVLALDVVVSFPLGWDPILLAGPCREWNRQGQAGGVG